MPARSTHCLTTSIDLILCDIGDADAEWVGICKITKRAHRDKRPMVIFTTAYAEYAIDGFRLEATRLSAEAISYDDFERSVNRAINLWDLCRGRKCRG